MLSRVVVLLLLMGGVLSLAQRPLRLSSDSQPLLLPRPEVLRTIGKSELMLVTDLYWLKAINSAVVVRAPIDGAAMLALGGLIADLDPRYRQPYWLTALNAPVPIGSKWFNAVEAANHLRRGQHEYPDDFPIAVSLSYNLMSYQHDFPAAAEVLLRQSRRPGQPAYLAPLATRLLAAAGRYDASRELSLQLEREAPDEATREFFRNRRKQVDLAEVLGRVDQAAQAFTAQTGAAPQSVAELMVAGFLTEVPVDPFGGSIEFDDQGRSRSSVTSDRLELHE